jgi:serine/threonine protein kinase
MCYLFIPYSDSCRCHIPEPGVAAIHPNIPAIFDTYKSFENDALEHKLRVLKPLEGDTRSSVFHVYAENIRPNAPAQGGGNCAAKLAFHHYGVNVHQALALADFAPRLLGVSSKPEIGASLYLMEYLAPPVHDQEGWVTLHDLTAPLIGKQYKLEEICSALDTFAQHLQSLKLVHGDLRPNNIMIKVDGFQVVVPVVIKVIDFEWANVADKGHYPLQLNAEVGYPGIPGGPIEIGHDTEMVGRCQIHIRTIMGVAQKETTT